MTVDTVHIEDVVTQKEIGHEKGFHPDEVAMSSFTGMVRVEEEREMAEGSMFITSPTEYATSVARILYAVEKMPDDTPILKDLKWIRHRAATGLIVLASAYYERKGLEPDELSFTEALSKAVEQVPTDKAFRCQLATEGFGEFEPNPRVMPSEVPAKNNNKIKRTAQRVAQSLRDFFFTSELPTAA